MTDSDSAIGAAVQDRASRVRDLLSQHKNEEAIKASLQDPPINLKVEAIKQMNAKTVLSAVLACNKGEMKRAIETLLPQEEDFLMKYLVKFLAVPAHSSVILDWHMMLTAKAGTGCIMRTLTDRKGI